MITRAASGTLLAIALYLLIPMVLYMRHGGYVTEPLRVGQGGLRLVFGVLSLIGWQYLRCAREQWRRKTGQLVLLAISSLVAFLGAELALRKSLRDSQGFSSLEDLRQFARGEIKPHTRDALSYIVRLSTNKKLIYELRPGLDRDFDDTRVVCNSVGAREQREYAPGRKSDTIRIVGIGDSGMFGWGVDQGEDYLAVLEETLGRRDDGKRYEIINLAVPGYNTRQEIEILKDRGLQFRPDIVIIDWSYNDFSAPLFLYERKAFNEWTRSYVLAYLLKRHWYRKWIRPDVRKRNRLDRDLFDPMYYGEAGEEGVRRALVELKDLAREHGFQPIMFGAITNLVTGFCEEIDLPYYDLYTEIPRGMYPKEDYAIHWIHPRTKGHQVLAEHLERNLESRGWIPVAGSVRSGE
ncbi:MAG: SGNH/GDSL hydrolase family protein [Verrucomicrobia bacterium]|nr:SGNH/GDSL hydrolase family protein [Verrucomicrobiota bacterium]MDA1087883.1 SGNH/GDSL hydrolase family protein [Verrucomicrobiota bacterium]